MFWDKVSPLYDIFENIYNGKVYTDTGKKVAGNVIHLLPNPEKALRELERVVKPGGRIIIPTYINMSKGTGTAAVKFITLLGADFKRQFNLE
jgi:SAM-dependent methyltransferase